MYCELTGIMYIHIMTLFNHTKKDIDCLDNYKILLFRSSNLLFVQKLFNYIIRFYFASSDAIHRKEVQ